MAMVIGRTLVMFMPDCSQHIRNKRLATVLELAQEIEFENVRGGLAAYKMYNHDKLASNLSKPFSQHKSYYKSSSTITSSNLQTNDSQQKPSPGNNRQDNRKNIHGFGCKEMGHYRKDCRKTANVQVVYPMVSRAAFSARRISIEVQVNGNKTNFLIDDICIVKESTVGSNFEKESISIKDFCSRPVRVDTTLVHLKVGRFNGYVEVAVLPTRTTPYQSNCLALTLVPGTCRGS